MASKAVIFSKTFTRLYLKERNKLSKLTNLTHAITYFEPLFAKLDELEFHPLRYPPCRNFDLFNLGYRCFNFNKYIIVYEVSHKHVRLLAIFFAGINPQKFLKIVSGKK